MRWSTIEIGKWRGKNKSLPQIGLSDPDWFFWAYEEGIRERVSVSVKVVVASFITPQLALA